MGFLRKNPEGTHLGQINDAYPSVAADIAHLQKEVRPDADIAQLASFMYWGDVRFAPFMQCLSACCSMPRNEWAVLDSDSVVKKTSQCKTRRVSYAAMPCRERCGACRALRRGSLSYIRASNRLSSESRQMWLPCGMR